MDLELHENPYTNEILSTDQISILKQDFDSKILNGYSKNFNEFLKEWYKPSTEQQQKSESNNLYPKIGETKKLENVDKLVEKLKEESSKIPKLKKIEKENANDEEDDDEEILLIQPKNLKGERSKSVVLHPKKANKEKKQKSDDDDDDDDQYDRVIESRIKDNHEKGVEVIESRVKSNYDDDDDYERDVRVIETKFKDNFHIDDEIDQKINFLKGKGIAFHLQKQQQQEHQLNLRKLKNDNENKTPLISPDTINFHLNDMKKQRIQSHLNNNKNRDDSDSDSDDYDVSSNGNVSFLDRLNTKESEKTISSSSQNKRVTTVVEQKEENRNLKKASLILATKDLKKFIDLSKFSDERDLSILKKELKIISNLIDNDNQDLRRINQKFSFVSLEKIQDLKNSSKVKLLSAIGSFLEAKNGDIELIKKNIRANSTNITKVTTTTLPPPPKKVNINNDLNDTKHKRTNTIQPNETSSTTITTTSKHVGKNISSKFTEELNFKDHMTIFFDKFFQKRPNVNLYQSLRDGYQADFDSFSKQAHSFLNPTLEHVFGHLKEKKNQQHNLNVIATMLHFFNRLASDYKENKEEYVKWSQEETNHLYYRQIKYFKDMKIEKYQDVQKKIKDGKAISEWEDEEDIYSGENYSGEEQVQSNIFDEIKSMDNAQNYIASDFFDMIKGRYFDIDLKNIIKNLSEHVDLTKLSSIHLKKLEHDTDIIIIKMISSLYKETKKKRNNESIFNFFIFFMEFAYESFQISYEILNRNQELFPEKMESNKMLKKFAEKMKIGPSEYTRVSSFDEDNF